MKNSNTFYKKGFAPLDGRIIKKQFIGFDCETYGDKNTFRLGSFVFENYVKTF